LDLCFKITSPLGIDGLQQNRNTINTHISLSFRVAIPLCMCDKCCNISTVKHSLCIYLLYYRIFPSITRTLCIQRTQYFPVLTNLLYRYRAPENA
jgi:hypothetical protein